MEDAWINYESDCMCVYVFEKACSYRYIETRWNFNWLRSAVQEFSASTVLLTRCIIRRWDFTYELTKVGETGRE